LVSRKIADRIGHSQEGPLLGMEKQGKKKVNGKRKKKKKKTNKNQPKKKTRKKLERRSFSPGPMGDICREESRRGVGFSAIEKEKGENEIPQHVSLRISSST